MPKLKLIILNLNNMDKSQTLLEIEGNLKEMEELIGRQKFNVVDAQRYMMRWYNFYRSLEDVTKSRDKWKAKYTELKNGI